MLNLLNKKWQDWIIKTHSAKIQAISADAERSMFFNKYLSSRNLESMSQQELVSTITQAINMAYSLDKELFEEELSWVTTQKGHVYNVPQSSPIALTNLYSGFDYSDV